VGDSTGSGHGSKTRPVLYNLLANGLRHTATDGSVAVGVRALAHEVCVTVEDAGPGFRAEAVEAPGISFTLSAAA
jgi:signal transduction histidine kinase